MDVFNALGLRQGDTRKALKSTTSPHTHIRNKQKMTDLLTSDFLKKYTATEDMSQKEFLLLEKTI